MYLYRSYGQISVEPIARAMVLLSPCGVSSSIGTTLDFRATICGQEIKEHQRARRGWEKSQKQPKNKSQKQPKNGAPETAPQESSLWTSFDTCSTACRRLLV